MESQEVKPVQRFPAADEAAYLKALSTLFVPAQGISEDTAAAQDRVGVIDPANFCMVYGKTEPAKRILSRFLDPDTEPRKVPDLAYGANNTQDPTSKYSGDYLKKMVGILTCTGGKNNAPAVRVTLAHDYPATFENDDFAIVLAPRVEHD